MESAVRARIGMVNFINTAPLYEVWKKTVNRPEWQVVEDSPAELNKKIYENQLDLGFISSHEYAVHPERYEILGNLSISSSGSVGSVFLFSNVAPEKLSGKKIRLSPQSQTSNSLVRIILKEFYNISGPSYSSPAKTGDEEFFDAVLAIGDEALRLTNSNRYPVKLDLGEEWLHHTGLPFVFAVWAVREDFYEKDPDSVFEIHRELLRCVTQGREELHAVSKKAAPRIPMSQEACYAYLSGIEYDLGLKKQEGLTLFFQHLIQNGEASPEALPLKICG